MSTNHSDDPVAQIVGAFERMPVPPGPSVRATIELLRERAPAEFDAAGRPEISPVAWKRFFHQGRELMRRPIPRFIAAAAACLAVFAVWSFGPGQHSTAHAFEKFAKALVEARSATFEMTMKIEGRPEHKTQSYYLAPGKMRNESKGGGMESVGIVDTKTGSMLILLPSQKTATIMNMKNLPKDPKNPQIGDIFEQMRELLSKNQDANEGQFKPIGEKEIDGRRAVGFRYETPLGTTTLWGDPKTGLPVLVEQTTGGAANVDTTMSHFVLNGDLKPELFDLTPPPGYKVETLNLDASRPTEEALIETFEVMADANDGKFLDDFDIVSLMTAQIKKQMPGGVSDPQEAGKLKSRMLNQSRGINFALLLPKSADAHYAGKGVKRDQPDRPIFWYKPEGSDKYRVIYADLMVKEAEPAPQIAGAVRVEGAKPAEEPAK